MTNSSCFKCGSNKIIKDARIIDYGHLNQMNDLAVHIKTTDKIFFNKFEKGKFQAQICGSCGHVELSIQNPQELWEAYIKSQSK